MYFDVVIQKNNVVIMRGYYTCSNCEPLNGPAIWTGKVENYLLSERRVYLDTSENRKKLGMN
jgi:hypothetical protein